MAADTQQLQGEVNDSPADHASLIPVEMMLKQLLAALIEEEKRELGAAVPPSSDATPASGLPVRPLNVRTDCVEAGS